MGLFLAWNEAPAPTATPSPHSWCFYDQLGDAATPQALHLYYLSVCGVDHED